jgi:hypothetical protein
MKKIALGCLVVAGLVFGSAGAAVAGETRGNGDPNENSGQPHSACHFSGLDEADSVEQNPPPLNDDAVGMRGNQAPAGEERYHGVQNWGAFVQADAEGFLIELGAHPGQACRGNAEFEE